MLPVRLHEARGLGVHRVLSLRAGPSIADEREGDRLPWGRADQLVLIWEGEYVYFAVGVGLPVDVRDNTRCDRIYA